MSLKSFGRTLAKAFSGRVSKRGAVDPSHVELAKRIEQRAHFVSMEAHAYVDQRISALKDTPPEMGKRIEERALLASQEAKAYADGAVHSLSMSLRGMSKVVLRIQQRVEAFEEVQSDLEKLGQRLTQIEQRLDAIRDQALEERIETQNTELGELTRRIDEDRRVYQQGQGQLDLFDDTVRNLSAQMVEMETELRELDGRFKEIAQQADAPRAPRSLRRPGSPDIARHRSAE